MDNGSSTQKWASLAEGHMPTKSQIDAEIRNWKYNEKSKTVKIQRNADDVNIPITHSEIRQIREQIGAGVPFRIITAEMPNREQRRRFKRMSRYAKMNTRRLTEGRKKNRLMSWGIALPIKQIINAIARMPGSLRYALFGGRKTAAFN